MKSLSKTFTYSALSASIAFINAGVSSQAFAQDEEELVVTGIRAALTRSSDLKRENAGVVDAISAEDIGKFPDTNLAESLQRITGVSIDRSNNEGQQITVRGFGPRFNLVTLNGRTMPTSTALNENGISRGFNFNELSSSSISAVEVYKTGRADLPTGGIGATVNIRTAKPFDYDGFTISGVAKAVHDTTNKEGDDITPDIAFIASNTFAEGKFGLLVSGSYSERDSREEQGHVSDTQRADNRVGVEDGINSSANENPDDVLFMIRNFNLEVADTERERKNAQFVAQFAPIDSLEIGVDYTLSRFEEERVANSTGFWFGFNGTRSGDARSDGVVNLRDVNQDIDFFGLHQLLETDNDSFGINVDWQVNDSLNLNFDAHSSKSESQPNGDFAETIVNIFTRPEVSVGVDFIDGEDIPRLSQSAPFDPFDQANLLPDIALQRGFSVENTINEFKFAGQFTFDEGVVKNVDFGTAYTDYEYDSDQVFNFIGIEGFDISQVPLTFVPRGSVGSDFSGSEFLLSQRGTYDTRRAVDLVTAEGRFGDPVPTQNTVTEETTSVFVSTDLETSIGYLPFTARLGLRYEETDSTGESVSQLPTGTWYRSTAEITTTFSDSFSTESISDSYSVVLPSLDFALDITDDLKARFSYTESMTRAPIAQLAPGTQIATSNRPNQVGSSDPNSGVFTATRGNAGLEPTISENIDLSLEWYYKDSSYVSIGYFDKTVNAFLSDETVESTIIGADGEPVRNASANPRPGCPSFEADLREACTSNSSDPAVLFDITRPTNSPDESTINGFELAWQHAFDFGLGFIANYTFTDGDLEFDVSNFDEPETRPLTGLSDSANFVLFFENDRFETRIAYNWRDKFLSDFQENGEPTFTEAYAQLDAAASFNINDFSSVFIEGLNLTDETTRRHGRSRALLRDVFSHGPRYAVGYRVKF